MLLLRAMLIGAHVSPAGGPAKALERGAEVGATVVQIFNQSPRMWRPSVYSDDQIAAYYDELDGSPVEGLLIHAIYLLNCAAEDKEIRDKSRTSLIASLQAGDRLEARGVVLHPGSALKGEIGPAIKRAGKVIQEALSESERCPLHLENTAGAGGTLGRSFEEVGALFDAAGGDGRLGLCLDSCHVYASGYDIRTAEGLTHVLDDFVAQVGLERLGSLHLNDSQGALGSNRDRHANLGEGELGESGCAVFLSEPRFQELPIIMETPKAGEQPHQIDLALELHERGAKARAK
jgi:deoxyribonuclease-4